MKKVMGKKKQSKEERLRRFGSHCRPQRVILPMVPELTPGGQLSQEQCPCRLTAIRFPGCSETELWSGRYTRTLKGLC